MRPGDEVQNSVLPPRRFTVEEYHRLISSGALSEESAVELLNGIIVDMTPQNRPHAQIISRLTRRLAVALAHTHAIRVQLPLTLSEESEPEPDIAVVTLEEEERASHHPRTALLVVEVAGDSIQRDRLVKGGLYARAGVPEYWIVDVGSRNVEVYSAPDATQGRYGALKTLSGDDALCPNEWANIRIPLSDIFQPSTGNSLKSA